MTPTEALKTLRALYRDTGDDRALVGVRTIEELKRLLERDVELRRYAD
jgi:hypothetical protein